MIHPHTKVGFISDEVGFGVIATKFIPAGTITWALDNFDQEFTPAEFEAMDSVHKNIIDIYCYRNKTGNFVLCWDNGRFVNHSFNSNCLSTAYDFEIAIRDIQVGEQLTDDYGYLNITEPFEGIEENTERKIVYPDDLKNFHKEWDEKLLSVFDKIPKVKQDLRMLISDETWKTVEAIAADKKEMKSILENLYVEQD
ncbi:SET domain-containing protein [Flavimarina sp. Hel_I_48]|uniref:SET domain-containing protein n=1 Tax=Flavimarina sp. Hel_I_48 TaxID=1392488 RepID=UPI0004DF48E4|nr:SET domain-containing protein [Flavimarina sp. Hel_I_48]